MKINAFNYMKIQIAKRAGECVRMKVICTIYLQVRQSRKILFPTPQKKDVETVPRKKLMRKICKLICMN